MNYPLELNSFGRKGTTVSSETKFVPLEPNDMDGEHGTPPLETLKKWAAMSIDIVSSGDGNVKGGATANIEATHIEDARVRTEIAMKEIMEEEVLMTSGDEDAEVVSLCNMKLNFIPPSIREKKGQPIVEVVRTSSDKEINDIVSLLAGSISKNSNYAAQNKKLLFATECLWISKKASELNIINNILTSSPPNTPELMAVYTKALGFMKFDVFKKILSGSEVKNGKVYKIYKANIKTPNPNKVDKNGLTRGYSLSVMCSTTHIDYPFDITITTMKGRPKKDGSVGFEKGTVCDTKTYKASLSTWEWLEIIERGTWEKKCMESDAHEKNYALAQKYSFQNRTAAQATTQANAQVPVQPTSNPVPDYVPDYM